MEHCSHGVWENRRFGHKCAELDAIIATHTDTETPPRGGASAATRTGLNPSASLPSLPLPNIRGKLDPITYDEVLAFDADYAELYLFTLDLPPNHRQTIVELIATAMACAQENAA